jgi:diacylglycerol kinase family enzyme
MILPELDHASRLDAFSRLLREGAAAVRAELVTARSSWIEYESENDLNVNLDGEPTLVKQFRVECRQGVYRCVLARVLSSRAIRARLITTAIRLDTQKTTS